MKKLYIIGNGFDIAHGLDTAYWDFRSFLFDNYPQFLENFEYWYNVGRVDFSSPRLSANASQQWEERTKVKLWYELENVMGCPNIYEMMDRSESVLNDMDLDSGLVGIESTMNSYWQEQYGYINKFEQYVKEWIETIDTTDIEPKRMALVESTDYFLNFNYTDTLETVYKIEDVLHIHGGVSSVSDIDPIMGHCNYQDIEEHRRLAGEADEVLNEGEASIHRAIANYLRSIYKDTNSIISLSESFWEKLSDIDAVVVVGWAAGKADWPYLRKIQKSIKDDTKWHVYYYDNKALAALSKAMQEEGIEGKYEVTYMQTREFWD